MAWTGSLRRPLGLGRGRLAAVGSLTASHGRKKEGSQKFPDGGAGSSCPGEPKPGAAHIPASLPLSKIKLGEVFRTLESIVQMLAAVLIPLELSRKPHYLPG